MKMKNLCSILILLLFSSVCFAQNKTVVFFAESLDGISDNVVKKITSSDKFCLAVCFDETKYIKPPIRNLIISHKIEPTLNIGEPYFPIVSSEVNISSAVIFDKVSNCENLIQNYKDSYKNLFETYKYGLYLKGASLDNETLKLFYKKNILWTIAKSEDDLQKGLFIKNNVALFVPYKNFTTNETKIKQWFASVKEQDFIPIVLTNWYIKNEKFMLELIKFLDKDKTIDVELPINAAFYGYNSNTIRKDLVLKEFSKNIPRDNMFKLYLVDKEIEEYGKDKKDDEMYSILCDEFFNMYSYNVMNGIANNNMSSIRLFDISYKNIFKILNKKVPNVNEFKESLIVQGKLSVEEDFAKEFCKFVDVDGSIIINNDSDIITLFSISKDKNSVSFTTDADLSNLDSVDIYIDMNGILNIGNPRMLNPLNSYFVPEHNWEYAIRITKDNIYIYKFVSENVDLIQTIPNDASKPSAKIPSNIFRGDPYNWNYQVVAVKNEQVIDFIEDKDKKTKIFKSLPLQLNMFKYYK